MKTTVLPSQSRSSGSSVSSRSPPAITTVVSPTRMTAAEVTNPRFTRSSVRSERGGAFILGPCRPPATSTMDLPFPKDRWNGLRARSDGPGARVRRTRTLRSRARGMSGEVHHPCPSQLSPSQSAYGHTPIPSWVAAAGVPDPEKVEPTKMPHEPGEEPGFEIVPAQPLAFAPLLITRVFFWLTEKFTCPVAM